MNSTAVPAAAASPEQVILKMLLARHPEVDFAASADFVADGLLDSFDIILLTTELEAAFGVSVPGEDVLPANFANCAAIARLLQGPR